MKMYNKEIDDGIICFDYVIKNSKRITAILNAEIPETVNLYSQLQLVDPNDSRWYNENDFIGLITCDGIKKIYDGALLPDRVIELRIPIAIVLPKRIKYLFDEKDESQLNSEIGFCFITSEILKDKILYAYLTPELKPELSENNNTINLRGNK